MDTLEQLYRETDFVKVCRLLREFAKSYTVIIAADDTPCGSPDFTFKVAQELMNIGLKIALHDKYRYSYAAVIHKGRTVFEKMSPDKAVEAKFEFNGHKIAVCSRNHNLRPPQEEPHSWIEINEHRWPIGRGLTFVIWDSGCNKFLYFVRFDTYAAINKPHRHPGEYSLIPFYLKRKYPNRRLLTLNSIKFPAEDTEDKSDNEILISYKMNRLDKLLASENFNTVTGYSYYKFFQENKMFPWFALNEYIDNPEEMMEIIAPPKAYIATDSVRRMYDYCGKYLNIMAGHRVTLGNPDNASRTIWFLGGCLFFCTGARDEGTIQSRLQALLNDNVPDLGFSVQNYGCFLWDVDAFTEIINVYESLPIGADDITIIQMPPGFKADIDVSEMGKRPHNYGELFWDTVHHTENAYRLIAEKTFEYLKKNNFYADDIAKFNTETELYFEKIPIFTPTTTEKYGIIKHDYGLSQHQQEQLDAYKQTLRNFYDNTFATAATAPKVGAIVMNCNPFTLGHRYLIEQAAKKVDFLIVFVVQEDKSFFPFADRIDLVDKGTADLPNVAITASGQFIISTLTFTEYFNKKKLQDMTIDSSLDVTLFAREIAPCMHISVRFAGSEPFDKVTKQYNDTLRAILPRYGIEFEEIPRIESDGEAISASRVRKLLKNKDFKTISKLVPKTTLKYLEERNG